MKDSEYEKMIGDISHELARARQLIEIMGNRLVETEDVFAPDDGDDMLAYRWHGSGEYLLDEECDTNLD